jgi:transposase
MGKNVEKVDKVQISPAKKKAAVDAILAGTMTRRDVAEQLGVDKSTVRDWLKKPDRLMDVSPKARPDAATRRRLAVAVQGGYMTVGEAMAEAGLIHPRTVPVWIKALDGGIAQPEKSVQDRVDGQDGALAQENRDLRARLANLQLQLLAAETVVEVAGEELGQDLRKKYGSKQWGACMRSTRASASGYSAGCLERRDTHIMTVFGAKRSGKGPGSPYWPSSRW